MKVWSTEDREKAELQVCAGGKDAGTEFFKRHPNVAFSVAVDLQCEINEARELLTQAGLKEFARDSDYWSRHNAWLSRNK